MHSLSLPLIRIAVSLSTWISPAVFDIFCYTMLELPKVSSKFSLTLKGQTTICMSRDQPYCLTFKKMYKIDAFYSEVLEIWYFECQSLKGTTRVLKIFKLTLTWVLAQQSFRRTVPTQTSIDIRWNHKGNDSHLGSISQYWRRPSSNIIDSRGRAIEFQLTILSLKPSHSQKMISKRSISMEICTR